MRRERFLDRRDAHGSMAQGLPRLRRQVPAERRALAHSVLGGAGYRAKTSQNGGRNQRGTKRHQAAGGCNSSTNRESFANIRINEFVYSCEIRYSLIAISRSAGEA